MNWCIVLVEMPLTRFEECWPLPTESLPEFLWNLNIVTLTLTLWPINSGVLTSLLVLHLSSSLTDSLPSLNLLCHSKSDARFMQDGRKVVWSIAYISVAFFPSLKQNFIAYCSSKVSDCIFEIHQLWESGFSRVYSNYCCSCSFEPEIIKTGQSSHKMYSNNILNFQESMTILNACTKKSGNLLNVPRITKEISTLNHILLFVEVFFFCNPWQRLTEWSDFGQQLTHLHQRKQRGWRIQVGWRSPTVRLESRNIHGQGQLRNEVGWLLWL